MSYAIIGFGKIGHALAKAFARNGIEVFVATTRDPERFASDAAAIGPMVIPTTLTEAVKADIIFLAVRFESHPEVAKALSNWTGKTIVDAMNTQAPLEELGVTPHGTGAGMSDLLAFLSTLAPAGRAARAGRTVAASRARAGKDA